MESNNLLNEEGLNVLLYISGLPTKDDLSDDIVDNCKHLISDFKQDSNLKVKTNEYENCELNKVPHTKISEK